MPALDPLHLLHAQEYALAELYGAFAEALPEMDLFWKSLKAQERGHGRVLTTFTKLAQRGLVEIDPGSIDSDVVRQNIEQIRTQAHKAKCQGIEEREALAYASNLEHSLLETHLVEIIRTSDPQRIKQLDRIRRQTFEHRDAIDRRLAECR